MSGSYLEPCPGAYLCKGPLALRSEALSSTLLSCGNTWVCMRVHMGEHESIAVDSSVWSPGGSSPELRDDAGHWDLIHVQALVSVQLPSQEAQ